MNDDPKRNKYKKTKDAGESRNGRILQQRRDKFIRRKARKEENTVEHVVAKYPSMAKTDQALRKKFTDFPLSTETLEGLGMCEYEEPTDIQRESLPFSLTGSDIVAAAKTGSGKTLALVIPVLESLWRSRWGPEYGLGAIIISPTRELALQTFTCINHVGKKHNFSCALLIGGTDVSFERDRIGRINIIVCTPGRLLHHMDENEQLNCDMVQMLVLDEADRMLDMGFSKQINAIVSNLPRERQTLLFSATQTKNVKDLSRVCAKDPVFVSVHEKASHATPDQLNQSFIVCEEEDKINIVWSFAQNHKKLKTIVFVSCCKQARFLTEAFSHLRPGVSVMGLWGTMNQTKRVDVFQKFEDRACAIMFCTDVASRGLDFSHVDWVVQMDAPATVDDYIHRVGRTARMDEEGNAVLLVTTRQEEALISAITNKNIPLSKLQVDPSAMQDIRSNLRGVVAQFSEMNQFAQKAIVSYLRSVYLMSDKTVFDVSSIDAAALADSYGLVAVPRLRFLNKKGVHTKVKSAKEIESDEDTDVPHKRVKRKTETDGKLVGKFAVDEEADADDLFTVKKQNIFGVSTSNDEDAQEINLPGRKKPEPKVLTKAKLAKKTLNKGLSVNTKKVFGDDDDEEHTTDGERKLTKEDNQDVRAEGLNLEEAMKEMKQQDKLDRQKAKEKRRRQKVQEKERQKKKAARSNDLDVEESGSEDEGPNLDWLPDPDEVLARYGATPKVTEGDAVKEQKETSATKPVAKKRRRKEIAETEAAALALLNPF